MSTPKRAADEPRRAQILEELGIHDSEPDAWLDRVTAYCSTRFRASGCRVTLVASDREWSMSAAGLAIPLASRRGSFCGRVVAENALLVVTDAFDDGRFLDNPLVTDPPRIRFYAGSPLRVRGQAMGALGIFDRFARDFALEDTAELAAIAEAVSWYLANRKRAPRDTAIPAFDGPKPTESRTLRSTSDREEATPWRDAVDYIQAHGRSVEGWMLGQVAFGFPGSGRERHILAWEEALLDPRALDIARRMIAARPNPGASRC